MYDPDCTNSYKTLNKLLVLSDFLKFMMWMVQRAVALAHCFFCPMLHLYVKSVSTKRQQSSANIWCSVLLVRLTGISVTTSWSAICPFIWSNWEMWLVVLSKSECVIISWDVIRVTILRLRGSQEYHIGNQQ